MPRHDMLLHHSKLDNQSLNQFCRKYGIPPEYNPTPPDPNHRVTDSPDGQIAVYTKFFESSNLRIPFSFFFLQFLKQYRVSIAQLSPLGVMKLLHFEIVCRALGGEPTLPLFRRFFRFARYGHWYTVNKHRCGSRGFLSWISKSSLPQWKDSFFWVSADAVPFKMHWRQHHEQLNVVHDRYEEYDRKLYRMLVRHPMPLQPFPEHVLVMTGLSRNWPYMHLEPILKDGDEEMGLLKYIEMKGVDVKLTARYLEEHEDSILDRTRGVCYEGELSRVAWLENVGDGNTGGGDDMEIHPERLLFGSDNEIDHPVVGSGTEKESVSERGKRLQLEQEVSGSCSKKPKLVKSVKEESNHVVMVSSSTDLGNDPDETTKDAPKPDRVGCFEQLVGSVPELIRWHERKAKDEARLRDKISRYRVEMSLEHAKNLKLSKKLRKLKDLKKMSKAKEKEARQIVAENTVEHQKVVDALQKELQNARAQSEEKLKQAQVELEIQRGMVEKLNGELEVEKEARTHERESFQKSLEQVSSERKWLIQEGFEYVINRLHRSQEYLGLLGAVQTNLWNAGNHNGVVEGHSCCKAGVALEAVSLYKPDAYHEFITAVHELEHTRFPYVAALARCGDSTLDELKALKPEGMEDGDDKVTAGGDKTM